MIANIIIGILAFTLGVIVGGIAGLTIYIDKLDEITEAFHSNGKSHIIFIDECKE